MKMVDMVDMTEMDDMVDMTEMDDTEMVFYRHASNCTLLAAVPEKLKY